MAASGQTLARGLASLLATSGTLELLLAPAARDRLEGLPTDPVAVVAAARATFEGLGLVIIEGREASADEVRSAGSTWAKRLLGANGRPVVLVRFRSP